MFAFILGLNANAPMYTGHTHGTGQGLTRFWTTMNISLHASRRDRRQYAHNSLVMSNGIGVICHTVLVNGPYGMSRRRTDLQIKHKRQVNIIPHYSAMDSTHLLPLTRAFSPSLVAFGIASKLTNGTT
jgi:hypothetical protein